MEVKIPNFLFHAQFLFRNVMMDTQDKPMAPPPDQAPPPDHPYPPQQPMYPQQGYPPSAQYPPGQYPIQRHLNKLRTNSGEFLTLSALRVFSSVAVVSKCSTGWVIRGFLSCKPCSLFSTLERVQPLFRKYLPREAQIAKMNTEKQI